MSSQKFGATRLETFSDGVFAIVITLLVLELRVPEVQGSPELIDGLKNLLPKVRQFCDDEELCFFRGTLGRGQPCQTHLSLSCCRSAVIFNCCGIGQREYCVCHSHLFVDPCSLLFCGLNRGELAPRFYLLNN